MVGGEDRGLMIFGIIKFKTEALCTTVQVPYWIRNATIKYGFYAVIVFSKIQQAFLYSEGR